MVRAKFRCLVVEDYGQSKKVKFSAACLDGPPMSADQIDTARFNRATPSGELWMTIDNPNAAIQFKPGSHYYLDFSEA